MISPLVTLFLSLLCVVLAIPILVLFAQILASVLITRHFSIPKTLKQPSVAVLIPAHNESLVIAQTLASLVPQVKSASQLVVVADNCSDDTATIAKKFGATVLERHNLEQRGKGYALDFGIQYLKDTEPEVLIIIDADCLVAPNAISLLAEHCLDKQRPIQALYLMQSPQVPSLKAAVAEFAWLIKNKARPLGFVALGLPCQLMGTGMAFMWKDILQVNLASGHIVEDMKLGVDMARMNKAPLFMPAALVTSTFPPTQSATNTQRARWEHGHLSVILSELPSLILDAIKRRNMQMVGMACDLLVPPLAVVALMLFVLMLLSAFAYSLLGIKIFIYLVAILGLLFSLSIMLAWYVFGRQVIGFRQLCYAPVYAIIKIPLYLKFFFNRQVEWVRSKRD